MHFSLSLNSISINRELNLISALSFSIFSWYQSIGLDNFIQHLILDCEYCTVLNYFFVNHEIAILWGFSIFFIPILFSLVELLFPCFQSFGSLSDFCNQSLLHFPSSSNDFIYIESCSNTVEFNLITTQALSECILSISFDLHPSENACSTLLHVVFDRNGYRSWRRAVLKTLSMKSKTGSTNRKIVKTDSANLSFHIGRDAMSW